LCNFFSSFFFPSAPNTVCEQAEILEWLTGDDAVKGRPATAGARPGTSGDRGATEVRP
jgi:hypothetical protein